MRDAIHWATFILLALGVLQAKVAHAQSVVYYHTDALGSVVTVTDASRNVVEKNEYEPYGKVVNHALQDGPGFTGHVADSQTGLIYMQQRYYDDDLGEFPTVDPVSADSVGGNFNRYRYAANNPYRFIDPDGRCDTSFCNFWGGVGRAIRDTFAPVAHAIVDPDGTMIDTSYDRVGPGTNQIAQGGYKFGGALMVAEGARGVGKGAGSLVSTETRIADNALVVRAGSDVAGKGANSVEGLARGTSTHPTAGVTGFSAESANGASLCQLCGNMPNYYNEVGVTTAGQVRAAGGDVVATPGVSPTHATVTGLTPQEANRLLTPTIRNPLPKPEKKP